MYYLIFENKVKNISLSLVNFTDGVTLTNMFAFSLNGALNFTFHKSLQSS